jgi:hypothetical protein
MRNQAHPNWRWGPMLVEVEGERVRVLAGLAMRMRLLQILGPLRALRVAQAVTCGAQIASPSRMQPLLLSFLILLTMLLFSHNAFAYSVCCKWSTNYATYRYGYLPMAFWDPTDHDASAWSSVPTTSWRYIKYSGSPNSIEWGGWDGPGNVLAVTVLSGYGYTIQSFWIRYDKDENWYTGAGTPASNQFDAWSVITHEFGHALGLRDTQSIYCPGNATDATMCGQIFRGTTWFRSLEADDRNGVSYLYPR